MSYHNFLRNKQEGLITAFQAPLCGNSSTRYPLMTIGFLTSKVTAGERTREVSSYLEFYLVKNCLGNFAISDSKS